jgi:signal peptidase I
MEVNMSEKKNDESYVGNEELNIDRNSDKSGYDEEEKLTSDTKKDMGMILDTNHDLQDKNNSTKDLNSKNKLKSIITDVILYALIVYACIYLIPTYVMQRTIVDGPSMENSLHNGEHLLVEKVSYHFDALDRFDVIVFYPYGREVGEYYVKRVIGLPGETVQIKGSDIYINGEILEEDYGKDPIDYAGWVDEPVTIGEDEYFVLGDNREVSLDSRYEEVGLITKDNIGGKAVLRIWPFNKFGFVN